jgi:hypothetical protein
MANARYGLPHLVPIEQIVEPNRHGLDVTIGGRENVAVGLRLNSHKTARPASDCRPRSVRR